MTILLTDPLPTVVLSRAAGTAAEILIQRVAIQYPWDVVNQNALPAEEDRTRNTAELEVRVSYWIGNNTDKWRYTGDNKIVLKGADAASFALTLVGRGGGWGRETQQVCIDWLTENGYITGGEIEPDPVT